MTGGLQEGGADGELELPERAVKGGAGHASRLSGGANPTGVADRDQCQQLRGRYTASGALRGLRIRADLGDARAQAGKDALHARRTEPARAGNGRTHAGPVEQRGAEMSLERRDRLTDCRLGHVQKGSCRAQAAALGRSLEGGQMAQIRYGVVHEARPLVYNFLYPVTNCNW